MGARGPSPPDGRDRGFPCRTTTPVETAVSRSWPCFPGFMADGAGRERENLLILTPSRRAPSLKDSPARFTLDAPRAATLYKLGAWISPQMRRTICLLTKSSLQWIQNITRLSLSSRKRCCVVHCSHVMESKTLRQTRDAMSVNQASKHPSAFASKKPLQILAFKSAHREKRCIEASPRSLCSWTFRREAHSP